MINIEKINNLLKITAIMIVTYVIMAFISHFSVYSQFPDYKISDSLSAILLKTEVPADFFLYFGLFIFSSVLIALSINYLTKKKSE